MTEAPKRTARLNINIDEKLHSSFKAAAALQGQRMTDLLIEFIQAYVREHAAGAPRKGKSK